jgi:hypothetical protein
VIYDAESGGGHEGGLSSRRAGPRNDKEKKVLEKKLSALPKAKGDVKEELNKDKK